MRTPTSRFVVVANRLPVDRVSGPDGPEWRPSPGGLVTALDPVLRRQQRRLDRLARRLDLTTTSRSRSTGCKSCRSRLAGERSSTTTRACRTRRCGRCTTTPSCSRSSTASGGTTTSPSTVDSPRRRRVAAEKNGVVWVQDYQLQLVPAMLRGLRPDLRIGFFLHIPFPPTELFKQLPWRDDILRGLLGADLVGFQRPGGASNFARLVRLRLGLKTHRDKITLDDGREVRARAFPISIDVDGMEKLANSESVDRARSRDPRRARRTPKRSCSASTGSTTRRAFGSGCAPLASSSSTAARRSTTPSSSRLRRRVASASSSTKRFATTSSDGSAGSTARSEGSAARPSATCMRRTAAKRWRRCSEPPTSWS